MRRVWSGLAMAIALAAITAGGVVIVQDGAPPEGTAHVWIDQDGGTCVDNASPVEYDTATACGSIDAANDVADNGDVIVMRGSGGSYGGQTITGSNGRSSVATLTVADGETVTLAGSLQVTGAAYLTINGGGSLWGEDARLVTTTGAASGGVPGGLAQTENQYPANVSDSDFITIQGADFGGWQILDSTNVTYKWNDIGPCHTIDGTGTNLGQPGCDNGSIEYCENAELPGECRGYNTDHLVEGNYLHDFTADESFYNGSGSDEPHWECMYVSYPNGLTIRGNIFVNCSNGGNLFNTFSNGDGSFTADYGYTDYLVENNVFTSSCNDSAAGCGGRTGEATGVGHCNIYSGNDFDNVIIRFNTLIDANFGLPCYGAPSAQGGFIASSDDFQVIGNVWDFPGSGETCGNDWDVHTGGADMTMNYNIFYSGTFTCGSNATNVGSSITGMIVANSLTAPDAHLTGATNTLDEYVPASLCPATDFEGDARDTSSGFCDAGADER